MSIRHIIVFCKNPVLGQVKTRLAATMGDQKALAIYNQLLLQTYTLVHSIENAHIHVFYSNYIQASDFWTSKEQCSQYVQIGPDLGERMAHAFVTVFEQYGRDQKVVIIGTDCPYLTSADVENAFDALNDSDCVIGPCKDGGYYLIGMNNFNPNIFQNIEWSTPRVFDQTVAQLYKFNVRFDTIRPLSDIDTETDWIEYQSNI